MKISDKNFKLLQENYKSLYPKLSDLHSHFGGPSVYFHQQALLECRQNFLSQRHIELIYATLASWGMHRMGKTKTKIVEFEIFRESILKQSSRLNELKTINLRNYKAEPVELLDEVTDICFELSVSVSHSRVVGNSKALAHIIPNIAPPVDREYSIRFFAESLYNFNGRAEELKFYRHILKCCHTFVSSLDSDDMALIDTNFNSSAPKMFDNLIMLQLHSTKNRP